VSRRRKGRDVHGVLLLDKPAGFSSNQAVQKIRWLLKARKAGHTGSLDPFATGMLPICLGEASKTATFMLDAAKTYLAQAVLGRATATGDVEGDIVERQPVPTLALAEIQSVLAGFLGPIEQVPPMYSALKHQGQPLYKLARSGREVPREPRTVTIHSIEPVLWESPVLVFRVECSKGTYVRTLAEDIARRLGTCAHLRALRRLSVGRFVESGMFSLDDLVARAAAGTLDEALLPPDAGLADWPVVELDDRAAVRFGHGNPIVGIAAAPGPVRVYGPGGLLGLGEVTVGNQLKAKRIMNLGS
jgi:tRNA pseudouridine55 synthase